MYSLVTNTNQYLKSDSFGSLFPCTQPRFACVCKRGSSCIPFVRYLHKMLPHLKYVSNHAQNLPWTSCNIAFKAMNALDERAQHVSKLPRYRVQIDCSMEFKRKVIAGIWIRGDSQVVFRDKHEMIIITGRVKSFRSIDDCV